MVWMSKGIHIPSTTKETVSVKQSTDSPAWWCGGWIVSACCFELDKTWSVKVLGCKPVAVNDCWMEPSGSFWFLSFTLSLLFLVSVSYLICSSCFALPSQKCLKYLLNLQEFHLCPVYSLLLSFYVFFLAWSLFQQCSLHIWLY